MHKSLGKATAPLILGALGVVYGDIGTSPLYAFGLAFDADGPFRPGRTEILGTLSLIIWALILIVCVKYVLLILRVDNNGEGGIMALMARALRSLPTYSRSARLIVPLGLLGTAFFLADSTITPAISVLSAVEGIEILAPRLEPFVVPISTVILVTLFAIQYQGTERVGNLFGPVMVVWFLVLAGLGINSILERPDVLWAIDPRFGLNLLMENSKIALMIMGVVVLSVTGVEALYADMGHFGRSSIRIAWFVLVFPALLLNYLGQGALLLKNPEAADHPFFSLAPESLLLPLIILATFATIIASQAVISGAFSICRQAVQMGYLPRLHIRHTSSEATGQIYVPRVNWLLLAAVLVLVSSFGSSAKLADAYGIAVTGTMLVTLILASVVFWQAQPRAHIGIVIVASIFFVIDTAFFSATLTRLPHGGYMPILLSIVLYFTMSTWRQGREHITSGKRRDTLPPEDFIAGLASGRAVRIPGAAVFMARAGEGLPRTLLHNLKHNKVLHEKVILMAIYISDKPRISPSERINIEDLGHGFYRVVVHFGFMEEPNVPEALALLNQHGYKFEDLSTSYFVGRISYVPASRPKLSRWRERIFIALSRNAQSAVDYFHLPIPQVVELGVQEEI
ncbi:MAG: potassium transporter Kup [Alphaproteobacteria bacterium]